MPTALALLVAGLLVFHSAVPDSVGHVGSLLENFLPWLGLAIPALFALALLRRSSLGVVAVAVPTVIWSILFADRLLPAKPASAYDLTVLQHNVSEENPNPLETARALTRAGADLVALEELLPRALPDYEASLAPIYPHHVVVGSVGLWSKYPLTDARQVDIRPKDVEAQWQRGLRATARTPHGDVAVYVAHLPSVRVRLRGGFGVARRNESAAKLGAAIATERLGRLILLGDLNATADDRGLAPVTSRLTPAAKGFHFSWPAIFPFARIDHVMTRAAKVTHMWTLPATASDHLPVAARITFQ